MESKPPLAALAMSLMVQDWNMLGFGDDPSVAATTDIDVVVERITALLLVRIVAINVPLGTFQDLSTSNICRTVLMKSKPWPEKITPEVIEQLREFVKKMVQGYKDTPYHNFEHAYHVTISVSRLLDLVLASSNTNGKKERPPPSYGLRNDPLNQLAMVFAALVHDVEHQGIPNRQLALEDDRLAILYNDQSIAENWSLYIAFSELLQDEFKSLREVMFGTGASIGTNYSHFRRTVVNLVLNTDIASPERTQISKSKWKEAFGDPYETVERKIRAEARRMSLGMSLTGQDLQISKQGRRGSNYSEISGEDHTHTGKGEDDSLSGTPENSVHQEENAVIQEAPAAPVVEPIGSQSMHVYPDPQEMERSMSMSMSQHGHNPSTKFGRRFSSASRRMSATSQNTAKYRVRLGILRTVDLSGETIETYSRASIGATSVVSAERLNSVDVDMDEPDELKMTVVMETIMTAADVAHNLQGWHHMVKWSGRLYMELRRAYQAKRGFDPQYRWFENQIGFLESYLLPLAHRLEDTGVFGPKVGPAFARIVEENRDRWLTQGYDETQKVIEEGATLYPVEDEEDSRA
jgi:hypothetical protein